MCSCCSPGRSPIQSADDVQRLEGTDFYVEHGCSQAWQGLSLKARLESPCTELEDNGGVGVCVAVRMNGIGKSDGPDASDAAAIASEFYGCEELPSPPDWPTVLTKARSLSSAFRGLIGRCSCRNFRYERGHRRLLARHGDASWTAA